MSVTELAIILLASTAMIGYSECWGGQPAGYASPGWGVVSRARYYARHRRARAWSRTMHIGVGICVLADALGARDLDDLLARLVWAPPCFAFVWLLAVFCVAFESRGDVDSHTGLPREIPWSERFVLRATAMLLYLCACFLRVMQSRHATIGFEL